VQAAKPVDRFEAAVPAPGRLLTWLDGDPVRRLAYRAVKFAFTGLVGAGVAYLLFIACLRVTSYEPATVVAWAGSVWFGFLVNRRFTFDVRGSSGQTRQAAFYVVGALLQLGLAMSGYAILIGRLGWSATPAFVVNTAVTAALGFAYQSLATFRRQDQSRR
jgi:putative flippase GtrA